jgi:hypothetical protein
VVLLILTRQSRIGEKQCVFARLRRKRKYRDPRGLAGVIVKFGKRRSVEC